MTNKVSKEQLTFNILDDHNPHINTKDSLKKSYLTECLQKLTVSLDYLDNENQNFSIEKLKEDWVNCNNKISGLQLHKNDLGKWIEATGVLLQLTAESKYAEELERIFLATSNNKIKEKVAGYTITKNVDHLHVNLFLPAKMKYEHSLWGKVSVSQVTDYPKSGKVEIKFSMEKKRYIELYIRIPFWEENAHVIVKGVKYLAPAGRYCKIAKQWKEGDSVEIIFPDMSKQHI